MSKLNRWVRTCGIFLLWAMAAVALPAQTYTTLHSFAGAPTDGSVPDAALVQGIDGNFYGTAPGGGSYGGGVVFKINALGTLTTLYNFCPVPGCTDGVEPDTALVQATDGDFYGTTFSGGTGIGSNCGFVDGCGTVFKIDARGTLTTLYSFCTVSGCPDGSLPAGLVQGTDGSFYGATATGGGTNASCAGYGSGCGTIFKITAAGKLTTLHLFNGTDGDYPSPTSALVQGTSGNFYGTTETGGANGNGTIFSITPKGKFTSLYDFSSTTASSWAGLIQATDGNFYGTAHQPGGNSSIFRFTPQGNFRIVAAACCYVYDGVVQGTDGNLYGTTYTGGNTGNCPPFGCGTIFSSTLRGTLTTLYNFCPVPGCTDGVAPIAALVQATDGDFYGTTVYGGTGGSNCGSSDGCGTVFSLSVGLVAFVETIPTSGKAGTKVTILGNNLTGTSSVTFNGTPATLLKVTRSAITTTVPTDATTGTVQVVTPGGTLSSNVPFTVK